MKRITSALAVLATATLAAGTQLQPAANGAAFTLAGGNVAHTWTPEYMSNNHSYSTAEAVALAKRFDVVAASPAAFRGEVGAMRKANPDIRVLSYSNAMFANAHAYSGLPETAFAHSLGGAHIKSQAFGVTLMEPSSAAWRNRSAATCQDASARGGYDGCLLDMLTLGIYSKGYVTALPKKPGTSRLYTEAEWRSGLIGVANSLQSQLPGEILIGNAVGNTFRYFDSSVNSQPITTALKGAQMEDFLRGARDSVGRFPDVNQWLKNVQVIRDFEGDNRTGFFTTKLWTSASQAQVAQWQAYAMATFLMGANGDSFFAFTPSRDKAGASGANSPYKMPSNLGGPTSSMVKTGNAYKRTFANGVALVNPTGSATKVSLGSTFTQLNGAKVSTVSLPAHSGQVLRKTV